MTRLTVITILALGFTTTLGAQTPPPPQGKMALEGTMKTFYKAANVVIVTTIDGVEHVYHFAKDLIVHGGHGTGVDALAGLREGSTVVVHYVTGEGEQDASEIDVVGDQGLQVTEGVVTHIDRDRKQITVRFDNGKTETLRLTDRAAAETAKTLDAGGDSATRMVIYYSDEAGQKVAHFFKKAS
jgi:hypothetical protein